MQTHEWNKVRYFKKEEAWGDPARIHSLLVFSLDAFREKIGRPIHITSGTQGKHAPNSQHYLGLAVDCIVDCGTDPPIDLILEALKFPFSGIGIYPKWAHSNMVRPLGFHFDFRQTNSKQTWLGISSKEGKTIEYGLTEANLLQFNLLYTGRR